MKYFQFIKSYLFRVFLTLFFLTICVGAMSQSYTLYVDGESDVDGDGTSGKPFREVQSALDEAYNFKCAQGHFVDTTYIEIRGGDYLTLDPIILNYKSSGLRGAPIVLIAKSGEEVKFQGGISIENSLFTEVKDRQILKRLLPEARKHVYVADLKKAGITEFDEIYSRGLNIPVKPYPMELFFNDSLMQVARWPNTGYENYGKVIDEGSIPRYRGMTLAPGAVPIDPKNPPARYAKYINDTTNRPGIIQYMNDRPKRWTEAKDLWMFGWWQHSWAEQTLKVKNIDIKKKEIGFEQPHYYGLGNDGAYYAFNLLEEIDNPGEYYIDRENGLLYFWPTSKLENADIMISLAKEPIFKFDHASNVILRNLTIELARGNGVEIKGGSNVRIENCVVRNIGLDGIAISDGNTPSHNHQVLNSEFYFIRGSAIEFGGGDIANLLPANHNVENNHFHHQASVRMNGVGNRFAHNLVHDNPYSAVNWSGNDHLIEYNEFYNCLYDHDDAGVLYTGRNPAGQGTVVRYNYFHHNGGRKTATSGTCGIYLDDGTTGQVLYGNIFYQTGKPVKSKKGAIFLHGAKDNIIVNNVFVECKLAIGCTPWPQDRWEKFLTSGDMKKRLYERVNIKDSLFVQRYPNLRRLKEKSTVNRIMNNIAVQCDEFLAFTGNKKVPQIEGKNWVTNSVDFKINFENLDFNFQDNSSFLEQLPEFKMIPTERIGLNK